MNKRFLVAWIAVFVVWMAGSFVVHGVLLARRLQERAEPVPDRGRVQRLFPLMLLAHVILAGAFVWIYARGVEDAPWTGQGFVSGWRWRS